MGGGGARKREVSKQIEIFLNNRGKSEKREIVKVVRGA